MSWRTAVMAVWWGSAAALAASPEAARPGAPQDPRVDARVEARVESSVQAPVEAPSVPELAQALSPAELAQRQIDAQRARVEAIYDQDRADCYQHFWVNPCVRQAKARRRVWIEDLRRQEIVLGDALRRERGAEQQQRIDERFSDEAIEAARLRREEALQEAQSRQEQAEQKWRDREALTAPEPRAPSTSNQPTAAEQASAREAFEDKQRTAAQTKARVEKALADKAAKPAVPGAPPTALPTPR